MAEQQARTQADAALAAQINNTSNGVLASQVAALEAKLARVSVSQDGKNIYITGANLHLQNGENHT
jgi:hypothetical protein